MKEYWEKISNYINHSHATSQISFIITKNISSYTHLRAIDIQIFCLFLRETTFVTIWLSFCVSSLTGKEICSDLVESLRNKFFPLRVDPTNKVAKTFLTKLPPLPVCLVTFQNKTTNSFPFRTYCKIVFIFSVFQQLLSKDLCCKNRSVFFYKHLGITLKAAPLHMEQNILVLINITKINK